MSDRIAVRLLEELAEALGAYPNNDWFVLALQGSQNYGIADEDSDVDSKMLLIPNFDDIVLAKKPISNTHEMSDTGEHVDCKDVRNYMNQFRKSNINFVEILFTDWFMTNSQYSDIWIDMRHHREEIARINPYAAISCMSGMAHMKYTVLEHPYPSKIDVIQRYGYDGKQLSHMLRIEYFTEKYTMGFPYSDCIQIQNEDLADYIYKVKRNTAGVSLEEAREIAQRTMNHIDEMKATFQKYHKNECNKETDDFLNDCLREIIKRSLKKELDV